MPSNKYIYIICAIIVIIVIGYIIIHKINNLKVDIKEIKHFSFSYSNGYHMYASTVYTFDYKEDKYIVTIKLDGVPDEDANTYEVDKNFENELLEILKKYDVSSWNGFNKVDKNVLDGNDFSLYIRFIDESSIDASGYMKWPKNYKEVKEELNKLFKKLIEGGNNE